MGDLKKIIRRTTIGVTSSVLLFLGVNYFNNNYDVVKAGSWVDKKLFYSTVATYLRNSDDFQKEITVWKNISDNNYIAWKHTKEQLEQYKLLSQDLLYSKIKWEEMADTLHKNNLIILEINNRLKDKIYLYEFLKDSVIIPDTTSEIIDSDLGALIEPSHR